MEMEAPTGYKRIEESSDPIRRMREGEKSSRFTKEKKFPMHSITLEKGRSTKPVPQRLRRFTRKKILVFLRFPMWLKEREIRPVIRQNLSFILIRIRR